jgi:tRNA/tmRNA/rRNA uracil-C5-methylase (TrmA/RlmC/RlmD family)
MAAHRSPFFGHAIWALRCLEATHRAQELRGYDTVAFDPPRQSAQAQVTQLAVGTIPAVIGIPCNVTAFARCESSDRRRL